MFEKTKNKITEKINSHLEGKKANRWLFGISFAESSFFPIPPDFFLIPIVVKDGASWWKKALNVTIASVLGGLFGYLIGFLFFETIGSWLVSLYGLEEHFSKVEEFFSNNAFLAIFTAAFTPIPYKVFTIAGGLFRIDVIVFIIASILGRGMRFFAVAYISKVFGKMFGPIVLKYFNIFTGIIALFAVIFLILAIF